MYGTDYSKYWNRFKVLVLDFECLSWNDYTYKEEVDNRGNVRFGKTKYQDAAKVAMTKEGIIEKMVMLGPGMYQHMQ